MGHIKQFIQYNAKERSFKQILVDPSKKSEISPGLKEINIRLSDSESQKNNYYIKL